MRHQSIDTQPLPVDWNVDDASTSRFECGRCTRISRVFHADGIILGVISTPRKCTPIGEGEAICYARTCYDHLAGELGVGLTAAFERKGLLVARGEREYDVTPSGEDFLAQWRINVTALRGTQRSFARRCLDWTERRDHVAGALGAAIYLKFLEFQWITRDRNSRIVRLTPTGRRHLEQLLILSRAA